LSFVSFLKQFGLDVLKGIQIFEGIEPAASAALSASGSTAVATKLDSLDAMVGAGLNTEAIFAAAFGPDNNGGVAKLQALIPQIQQVVANSEFMVGKKVADTALFSKAMTEYAQATVDLANSLHANVNTGNAALPTPATTPQPMPTVVPKA